MSRLTEVGLRVARGAVRALGAVVVVSALALAAPAIASASSGPALPSQDPFYTYSGSLAGLAPGAVLRTRPVTVSDSTTVPFSASQVLYRTTGELGQPTVTAATVIRPLLPVPTRIVSYQTAYDALGSQCDPSYTLQGGNPGYSTAADEAKVISAYAAAGFTVVVSDYEGTALDWGAGQESGYGTLDGIRAAESVLNVPAASTPVGLTGYSGGSIATEFATELAPTYAPQLDIVGAAEGGLPVDFAHNLSYINGSQDWSGVIPAVLVGIGRAFNIDMSKYQSPYGAQLAQTISDECINDFLGAYPGLTIQKLVGPQYQDFFAIPLFAKINNQLIMGATGTPKGPLFIAVGNADGTGDGVMVADDVEALAHTYCERGVSVQFNEYQGDDHDQAAIPYEVGALQFLTERLDGVPVANGCSSIGTGSSLAPLPVASPLPPPPPIELRLRYLGPRPRLHGLLIELRTNRGALTRLAIRLRRGRRVVDRVTIGRVGTHWRRVVLRSHRRMPSTGAYTLTVAQRQQTLVKRKLKLRRRRP